MKWIVIIFIFWTTSPLGEAKELFKDCFFIDNNMSAVELIFDDFTGDYQKDNCSTSIADETIARNVKFIKLSGYVFGKDYDFDKKQYQGQIDVDEIAAKFPQLTALDISNNSRKFLILYLPFKIEYRRIAVFKCISQLRGYSF